jgi:predicted alpha/beta-hydrolase family hydrolase
LAGGRPAFLLAPGAGAPSAHPRMQTFAGLLEPLGPVHPFDYPYMREGKKRPDPLPRLIAAHRSALDALRRAHDGPIVLVGKSMGGRIGCHLALAETVAAVICLGYPLCGGGDAAKLRDQVLLALATPAMFIQGTRDKLCPLDLFDGVRRRMSALTDVHVVQGGDHSLLVSKTELKSRQSIQEDVDSQIASAIAAFIARVVA